jgi:sugar phosphate isomerase/epimerase
LSVNALSSFTWSFDEDLTLWREMGVSAAGLLASKLQDDRAARMTRLQDAGIRPSTIVVGPFPLDTPASWRAAQADLIDFIDRAADAGGDNVYFPPGRTTGAPWREVLEILAEAILPCVTHAKNRGVRLGIEPSLRTDVSFVNTLRDAIDVAERTGLALIADFGNCWMERDLREVLQRAARHVSLVQICDVWIGKLGVSEPRGRMHLGEGELPLRRMMQEVLESGYGGLFDLEVLGPAIEAEGYASALRRGIPQASAFLTECGL